MFAGFGGLLGDTTRTNGITDVNINILRARVREGHPTPPALAMQTRHIFCSFRVIGMGYFADRKVPNRKTPPENRRGPFCEPLGDPAGYTGGLPRQD